MSEDVGIIESFHSILQIFSLAFHVLGLSPKISLNNFVVKYEFKVGE